MGNRQNNNNLCTTCMRAIKWVPVLLIVSIVVWSYYAYVFQLCILTVDSTFKKIILLIFYHIICILFLWSYWNTIFTPLGTVPSRWKLSASDVDKLERAQSVEQQKRFLDYLARDLPVHNRTINAGVRYCDKCKLIKPDRAHHCSVCGTCVLKMDHHCPWVNNCVNFSNYKFFVLFLGYSLAYCVYVALSTIEYFLKFWEGQLNNGMGKFHILFLFFLSVMFVISLASLFGYHLYLVVLNRTTLEAFRAPIFRIGGQNKNGYNLGKMTNFREVFGDDWKLWFLPVYTSRGDGTRFPFQSQHQTTVYESMSETPTRLDESSSDKFLINKYPVQRDESNTTIDFNSGTTNDSSSNANDVISVNTIRNLNNTDSSWTRPDLHVNNSNATVSSPSTVTSTNTSPYNNKKSLNNSNGIIDV